MVGQWLDMGKQEGAATGTIPEKQAQKSVRFNPLSLTRTDLQINRFVFEVPHFGLCGTSTFFSVDKAVL